MRSRILPKVLLSIGTFLPAMGLAQAQSSSGTASQAEIRVLVPSPDANLWFDDTPTQQRGTCRLFASPPLAAGGSYTYTIKASWLEKGRPITREKQVKVQPGQETLVDFTAPEAPTDRPLTPPLAPGPAANKPAVRPLNSPSRPGLDRGAPSDDRPLIPPIAPEPGRDGRTSSRVVTYL